MAGFPQFIIEEDGLINAVSKLGSMSLTARCTVEKHFIQSNKAFYREWEILQDGRIRVIMWDEHPRERKNGNVLVTVGTPSGRKGRELLRAVSDVLAEFGAVQSTIDNLEKRP